MGSFFFTLIFPVIAIAGAALQLVRSRRPRTLGHASEVFLVWFLVVLAGIGGVITFLSHTLLAEQTARAIGWPIGNPFQTEVTVANLAVGVLGILCYWIRGDFWLATVIATSVWLGETRSCTSTTSWSIRTTIRAMLGCPFTSTYCCLYCSSCWRSFIG